MSCPFKECWAKSDEEKCLGTNKQYKKWTGKELYETCDVYMNWIVKQNPMIVVSKQSEVET